MPGTTNHTAGSSRMRPLETESTTAVARGRGKNGELLFDGERVSVLQDEESPGDWLHNHVHVRNITGL